MVFLYYPEFLPDPMRPLGLASASAADRPARVSESYGTLRYGRLAEVLMYDCRRHLTMHGPSAVFVPPEVEAWLKTTTPRFGNFTAEARSAQRKSSKFHRLNKVSANSASLW